MREGGGKWWEGRLGECGGKENAMNQGDNQSERSWLRSLAKGTNDPVAVVPHAARQLINVDDGNKQANRLGGIYPVVKCLLGVR